MAKYFTIRSGAGFGIAMAIDDPLPLPIAPLAIVTNDEIVDGCCTAIPRYKIAFLPGTPSTLYLVHGRAGTGGSVWRSLDSGNTWSTLGTQRITDYHYNLDVDSSGRVFLGGPSGYDGGDHAEVRVWNGSSWNSDVNIDDYSGAYGTAHVLVGNGNDVFAFIRSGGGTGVIYWHRSTDNGTTFGSVNTVVDTGDATYKRMGGTFIAGQPACLVGYIGSTYTYRFFRWDGSDSFDAITNDSHVAVSNDDMNRIWGFAELANGQLHLVYRDIVGAQYVLRHTYRDSYSSGSWSDATTIHILTGTNIEGQNALTCVGNTLFMAFCDTPGATRQVFYRTWTASGGWSAATQISNSASGACGSNCNSARVIPGRSVPIMYTQGTSLMFTTVVV